MNSYKDFIPENEEEFQFVKLYEEQTKIISDLLKRTDKKDRFRILKVSDPPDTSLKVLFLYSLKHEDYEICDVANNLLKERGIKFKTDTW